MHIHELIAIFHPLIVLDSRNLTFCFLFERTAYTSSIIRELAMLRIGDLKTVITDDSSNRSFHRKTSVSILLSSFLCLEDKVKLKPPESSWLHVHYVNYQKFTWRT